MPATAWAGVVIAEEIRTCPLRFHARSVYFSYQAGVRPELALPLTLTAALLFSACGSSDELDAASPTPTVRNAILLPSYDSKGTPLTAVPDVGIVGDPRSGPEGCVWLDFPNGEHKAAQWPSGY